jgi:hypothetical protein
MAGGGITGGDWQGGGLCVGGNCRPIIVGARDNCRIWLGGEVIVGSPALTAEV